MSKPLPTEAEIYVGKVKQKVSPAGKALSELEDIKDHEIEETVQKIKLIKVQKELEEARRGTGMARNVIISKLFEGKTVDEINNMLNTMTPEAVDNLIRLSHNLDNSPLSSALVQPQSRSGDDRLMDYLLKKSEPQPQAQGITMADVVAIIKLIDESKSRAVASVPVQPQANSTDNLIKTIEVVSKIQQPYIDGMKGRDKELIELKLKEIESKMPQDPIETIKYVKEVSNTLGLGNTKTDVDLKLEEMRQNREVDIKRLDWEQKKWEMENEADLNKWEQIGKILQGPVGDVVKQMGSAGADRVRGRGASTVGLTPKPVQTQCPNCGKSIFVDANADTAMCSFCGAVLQKQGSPMPHQSQPTPVEVPTHIEVPTVAKEAEEQPTEQEEEENEPEVVEEGKPDAEPK